MNSHQNILISRTDNLGDVILTLPMAGVLKKHFPNSKIFFIGKAYTKTIIECCTFVDFFIDKEEITKKSLDLAKLKIDAILFVFPDIEIAKAASKAKIPIRIGTSHRWFHWLYANRLLKFSRKKSDLHEAQLNLKLLSPLKIENTFEIEELIPFIGWKIPVVSTELFNQIDNQKFNLILHPKSKGSAREWDLKYYQQLIQKLSPEKYQIWITGTKAEGEKILAEIPTFFQEQHVIDFTGKLTLPELIVLISRANALIACSTGPLHIAAICGIHTLGIFPPMRPLHPGRWSPIGKFVKIFVENKTCNDCKKTSQCLCINQILPETIYNYLNYLPKK